MIADYKTLDLFRIPVARVVTNLLNEDIAKYTEDFLKTNNLGYSTYFNKKKNDEFQKNMPQSSKFKELINEVADKFMNDWDYSHKGNPFIFWWASNYEEGNGHGTHIHPGSTLSGTYWPIAEEGCSPIKFTSPYTESLMQLPPKQKHVEYTYQSKTNDMLIWPSWLRHEVPNQTNSSKRIAISFNVVYDNSK
jgi:uncharacterized protein (TIGR02466 family)